MAFSPIPEILEELKAGRSIVLVDDEDRENEGDLVHAAENLTPEAVNFMVKNARGVVCHQGDPGAVEALFARLDAEGFVPDVVVVNAATNPVMAPLVEVELGAWQICILGGSQ